MYEIIQGMELKTINACKNHYLQTWFNTQSQIQSYLKITDFYLFIFSFSGGMMWQNPTTQSENCGLYLQAGQRFEIADLEMSCLWTVQDSPIFVFRRKLLL